MFAIYTIYKSLIELGILGFNITDYHGMPLPKEYFHVNLLLKSYKPTQLSPHLMPSQFSFLLRQPSVQLLITDVFLGSEGHVAKWIFDTWNCCAWKRSSSYKWIYIHACIRTYVQTYICIIFIYIYIHMTRQQLSYIYIYCIYIQLQS